MKSSSPTISAIAAGALMSLALAFPSAGPVRADGGHASAIAQIKQLNGSTGAIARMRPLTMTFGTGNPGQASEEKCDYWSGSWMKLDVGTVVVDDDAAYACTCSGDKCHMQRIDED